MSMLQYNEVTERKYIIFEGGPYEVLTSHVFRKQQRKPVNATKLRNMLTGKVTEHSFHVSEKIEEADISKKEIKYIYKNKGQFWFCSINDPKDRFSLEESMIGVGSKFLKDNSIAEALIFNDPDNDDEEGKIIGLKLPIKVELKVVEAHPAVKGNTAQGATKEVVLETGATIQVPLFIDEGDIIKINTENGEYVERAGQ